MIVHKEEEETSRYKYGKKQLYLEIIYLFGEKINEKDKFII